MENVKVAVRVRPFNGRETERGSKCIINMQENMTKIVNPANNETKSFTFDFSYWSHDPTHPNFASQKTVFNDLGITVLENAWAGYNVSLFAYGQTGSGKSYSMMGPKDDPGIIPLVCQEIFRRIDSNENEDISFRVDCSMLEIYNEKVRDLLNPKNKHNEAGLKVREHPVTGPYVEGLAKLQVNDYAQLSQAMEAGAAARTVAATQMNATSSRAHTVFTAVLTQTRTDRPTLRVTDRVARVHLIDLAGSERAASTGAAGDRLKEGAAINKSLSALGNCISALADHAKAAGAGAGRAFVPYRDSALTWLLKDSLGGNAKTIMIAALSPADINYEETLRHLRRPAARVRLPGGSASARKGPQAPASICEICKGYLPG
jgi:kinesin family member 1